MDRSKPKLRTVNKSTPAFPINEFPKDFPFLLGREIVYLLATKPKPELEGSEWEQIFSNCIGGEWKPSNVGLDDVVKGNTAWGAKTIKSKNPSKQKKIRLISGRNSPNYSFGQRSDFEINPSQIGKMVLEIWNERVSSIREKFKNLRTIVLIKSNDLTELVVFEFETIRYDCDNYLWEWNINKNLIGINKRTKEHCFTWQPHGAQFTIIEDVPEKNLILKIKQPEKVDKQNLLDSIGFDDHWIEIIRKS